MGVKSKIEWTENTWNPVTGCTKVSDGCKNCYAATLAKRLKLMGNRKYGVARGKERVLSREHKNIPGKEYGPAWLFK